MDESKTPGGDPRLKAKIRAAFDLFDKEKHGTVIQEEVPTIMRYLGAYPSETDVVRKVLPDIQEDEPMAFVTYEKFEKKMLEVLETQEFAPDSEDVLLQAFRTIDTEKKGYVEASRMKQLLVGAEGTPFRQKELDAFITAAKDLETGNIYYEDYIAMLTAEAASS